jgi:uncharacterized membrane protein YphA (DoxX/SURF4 family)
MTLAMKARHLPLRLTTGAFILHAGLQKLKADEEHAAAVHGMAAGTYPMFKDMAPTKFVRMLAWGEIATGSLLLLPIVPPAVAGAVLTGFSGGLMRLYMRTPGLREPGSIWPTQKGTGISKDVWMLAIGLSLLLDSRD